MYGAKEEEPSREAMDSMLYTAASLQVGAMGAQTALAASKLVAGRGVSFQGGRGGRDNVLLVGAVSSSMQCYSKGLLPLACLPAERCTVHCGCCGHCAFVTLVAAVVPRPTLTYAPPPFSPSATTRALSCLRSAWPSSTIVCSAPSLSPLQQKSHLLSMYRH